MVDPLPMFPLNTVLFPGVTVPLTVFEDRYRALVHHLLRVEDPAARLFGTVGNPQRQDGKAPIDDGDGAVQHLGRGVRFGV